MRGGHGGALAGERQRAKQLEASKRRQPGIKTGHAVCVIDLARVVILNLPFRQAACAEETAKEFGEFAEVRGVRNVLLSRSRSIRKEFPSDVVPTRNSRKVDCAGAKVCEIGDGVRILHEAF